MSPKQKKAFVEGYDSRFVALLLLAATCDAWAAAVKMNHAEERRWLFLKWKKNGVRPQWWWRPLNGLNPPQDREGPKNCLRRPPLAKTSGGRGARPLPPPPGINDLLVKREVENKTKTDRLMVGKTNGRFYLKFFWKRHFLPVNIQSR